MLEGEPEGAVASAEIGVGVAPSIEIAGPPQRIALRAATVLARVVDL